MRKYFIYIKIILFISILAFLFGFTSHRNNLKKVSDIDIKFTNGDNLFITYETVNKLLIQNYGALKTQPKETIILRRLEETLQSNEMIESADVFLTVDHKLCATITQKTPIARVVDEGVAYYLDSRGGKMPLSSNYSARVPLVSGLNSKNAKDLHELASMIFEDSFLQKQIIAIEVSPEDEFTLRTRVGKQSVELGSLDHIDTKFKKLEAFYKKVLKDKTLDTYQTINLKYHDQVVCTKN